MGIIASKCCRRISIRAMMLSIVLMSGCALNEPGYSNRAPVEVRRGEVYGKPTHQAPGGVHTPRQSIPIYEPADGALTQELPPQIGLPEPVPAVARLVSQAEGYIAQEDYQAAAAAAENALRLDPQSVQAYSTLARTYLFSNRYQESEQMGLRALSILRSLGPGVGEAHAQQLWQLIAQTRRARGDEIGAEQAMQKAGGRF